MHPCSHGPCPQAQPKQVQGRQASAGRGEQCRRGRGEETAPTRRTLIQAGAAMALSRTRMQRHAPVVQLPPCAGCCAAHHAVGAAWWFLTFVPARSHPAVHSQLAEQRWAPAVGGGRMQGVQQRQQQGAVGLRWLQRSARAYVRIRLCSGHAAEASILEAVARRGEAVSGAAAAGGCMLRNATLEPARRVWAGAWDWLYRCSREDVQRASKELHAC